MFLERSDHSMCLGWRNAIHLPVSMHASLAAFIHASSQHSLCPARHTQEHAERAAAQHGSFPSPAHKRFNGVTVQARP